DRVIVLDRGDQQTFRVMRRARDHGLEAGHMGKERFRTLAMGLAAEDAAAERAAHGDRGNELSRRAIAHPRRLADELVEAGIDIVGELDLGDRPQPVSAHADGDADNTAFVDRRVEYPGLAVFLLKTRGRSENPAEVADVLPQQDHVGIALEHGIERFVDSLDHRKRASRRVGQSYRLVVGVHSGHLICLSRIACWACSSRFQGSSSNTSSNMVWNGWCKPWPRMPFFSASRCAAFTSSS